jgi:hypothetical protein
VRGCLAGLSKYRDLMIAMLMCLVCGGGWGGWGVGVRCLLALPAVDTRPH